MKPRRILRIIPATIVLLIVQLACAWPLDTSISAPTDQAASEEVPSSQGVQKPQKTPLPNKPGSPPQSPLGGQPPGQGSQQSQVTLPPTQSGPTPGSPSGNQPACNNRLELDGNLNISQAETFETEEAFEVIWPIKNLGTCTWTSDYALKRIGGDELGAANLVTINSDVAPGQTTNLSVQMIAPANPGDYLSAWKMVSPQGEIFGKDAPPNAPLKVFIHVVQGSSSSQPSGPWANLTPMPAPGIALGWLSNGTGETLSTNKCYDLVSGNDVACSDPDADFRFTYATGQGGNLVPLNGLEFSPSMADMPSEDVCESQIYYSQTLQLGLEGSGSIGRYYCFHMDHSGDTAYGWLKPTNFNGGGITFDYVVYEPDGGPSFSTTVVMPNTSLFTLVSGSGQTMLDEECFDLTSGQVVSCSDSGASFKYNHNSYYGGILEPRLSLDFSDTMTSKPDKATCQAATYYFEAPIVFTSNPPGIYACFKIQSGYDTFYGWVHPTYFNNSGLTFDFTTYNP